MGGRVSYQILMAIFLINLEAVICARSPPCLTLCLSPSDKRSKNSFPFPQSVCSINPCINNWGSPVCFQRSTEEYTSSERGETFCPRHVLFLQEICGKSTCFQCKRPVGFAFANHNVMFCIICLKLCSDCRQIFLFTHS